MTTSPRKAIAPSLLDRAGNIHPEARISLALAGVTSMATAGYLYATSLLKVPDMVDPVGPTTFPYLIGGCLLLCVLGLIFEGVSKARMAVGATEKEDGKSGWDYLVSPAIILWTLIYFTAFAPLGFVLSSSIFLFGLMSVFHRGHAVLNIVVSVGFSVVSYLLFTGFFEVVLPPGPLFGGVF